MFAVGRSPQSLKNAATELLMMLIILFAVFFDFLKKSNEYFRFNSLEKNGTTKSTDGTRVFQVDSRSERQKI